MNTKAQNRELKKGFHLFEGENRKATRAHKSNKGLNNYSKGWVMQVIGIGRFFTWLQRVPLQGGNFKTIAQTKQL